jgi:hypothetical protein
VQVPAQPVAQLGALHDQVGAMVAQQLDLAGRTVEVGGGQVRLAQRCLRDGQRVDRVGLAWLAARAARGGHQPGRHPHHPVAGAQQVGLQPAGQVPAVLQREGHLRLRPTSGPP